LVKYHFFNFGYFFNFYSFFAFYSVNHAIDRFLLLSPILRCYDRFSIVIVRFTTLPRLTQRYRGVRIVAVAFVTLSPILHRYDRFSIVIARFLSFATRDYRPIYNVSDHFLSLS
jgi:hypothetical protein